MLSPNIYDGFNAIEFPCSQFHTFSVVKMGQPMNIGSIKKEVGWKPKSLGQGVYYFT